MMDFSPHWLQRQKLTTMHLPVAHLRVRRCSYAIFAESRSTDKGIGLGGWLMAHPNDVGPNGCCIVCGDRLSAVIDKRKSQQTYRRHIKNRNCSTKGRGEPK